MKKFLPIVLGSSLLIPGLANAVGLGSIKVESTLNQPLDAKIRLLSLRGASLADIQAVLATPEQFKRLNLESNSILALLKFEVTKDAKGKPIIRVFSREPITEPYIQILLDVKWPKGQLLRSYNILLDPPNYVLHAPAQQALPKVVASKEEHQIDAGKLELVSKEEKESMVPAKKLGQMKTSPTASITTTHTVPTQQARAASPQQPVQEAHHHYYGPIADTDSLWDIAKTVSRPEHMNINQVMVAIVQKNPEAFIRGNMNGLKRGAKVVLPTQDDLNRISAQFANDEVSRHASYWKRQEALPAVKPATSQIAEAEIPQSENAEAAVENTTFAPVTAAQTNPTPAEVATANQQANAAPGTIQETNNNPVEQAETLATTKVAEAQPQSQLAQANIKSSQSDATQENQPIQQQAQAQQPTGQVEQNNNQFAQNNQEPDNLNETPDGSLDQEVADLEKLLSAKEQKQEQVPTQVQEHQTRVSDIEKSPLLHTSGHDTKLERTLRAELALSAEATAVAREQNSILQQQLAKLQDQNRNLLVDISERDKQLQELKLEMTKLANVITQRDKQLSAQAYMKSHDKGVVISYKLLIATLIMLVSGSSYAWYRRIAHAPVIDPTKHPKPPVNEAKAADAPLPDIKPQQVTQLVKEPEEDKPRVIVPTKFQKEDFTSKHPEVSFSTFKPKPVEKESKKIDFTANMKDEEPKDSTSIEFESGLYDKSKIEKTKIKFHDHSDTTELLAQQEEGKSQPSEYERKLKLAKQHMKVHDFHEAYIILSDIIDNGDEVVAKEAQELLDQMQR